MPRSSRTVQIPGEVPADESTNEGETTAADPAGAAPADEAPAAALRASDVDPSKLKRAVLTVDGWVCPTSSPAPPGRE